MDEMSRRDMMKTGALAAAGLAVGAGMIGRAKGQTTGPTTQAAVQSGNMAAMMDALLPGAFDADGRATLPPLRYAPDALGAAIDGETMSIHHDRHHQGYVNGFNASLDALASQRESGDFTGVEHPSKKLTFHGGGHILHTIFWDIMGPEGGGEPSGALATAITRDFGSFEAFKNQFSAAARTVEGSGWGVLAINLATGRLIVQQVQNQNLLSMWTAAPILNIDVWEHAYYLRYQNRRAAYVDAWWEVVDWSRVGMRFDLLTS